MDEKILQRIGVKIGHYTDSKNLTGLTAFISEKGANVGIDIRGSNAGTFNTPIFGPRAVAEQVNAVVLTGGSNFGHESVFGVMQYLEEQSIGFKNNDAVLPQITSACIYDLSVGNSKIRPGKKEGYEAAKNNSYSNLEQGNIGVGIGATVGSWFVGKRMKGGFGIGLTQLPHDILVGAFVVTNAYGDVINPQTGKFYCDEGAYDLDKKKITTDVLKLSGLKSSQKNTTLGVIATNVEMDKRQLTKVAELAHDGLARSIFPVHTMLDGDTIFALSSLDGERKTFPGTWSGTMIDIIGIAAQDALMKAIKSSILHAKTIGGIPSYK